MIPILEIRNISKKYVIGSKQERYLSLRDRFSSMLKLSIRKKDFWALKDISLDVHAGESIGILGRNGAGKSTLLKILSKITPPTEGFIKARGRVASLLEVGTGFHPELNGRENIYLNGSILGLQRIEITRKFDEIVAFSEVEQFLDTPLKHYSSGMQLRLAFAVAAHLEPEILLIDEVLAVGDATFQQKCLGKMDEVSKSGRTVLFVSHNMSIVKKLCDRGILLENGQLTHDSSNISEVINLYNNQLVLISDFLESSKLLKSLYILDAADNHSEHFRTGELLKIVMQLKNKVYIENLVVRIVFSDKEGSEIFTCNNRFTDQVFRKAEGGKTIECIIPKLALNVGKYLVGISFKTIVEDIEEWTNVAALEVTYNDYYGTGQFISKKPIFMVTHSWEIK